MICVFNSVTQPFDAGYSPAYILLLPFLSHYFTIYSIKKKITF